MKKAKGDPAIHTVPEGAYEGGIINQEKPESKKKHQNSITTDAQGNGYPAYKNKQE